MSWWRRLLRRGRMEDRLEQELRFHLGQHAEELMARGHTPEEARRLARLALGGLEQVKEECRDARGTRWLEDFALDFQYTVRSLRQRPGFAAVALITLALGTGGTTLMFTVVNGVMLKPLAYPEPDRLVRLQEKTEWSTHWGDLWAFTYPNFADCRRESESLEMAAWRWNGGTVSGPGEAERADGFQVTANLFSVLGTAVSPGRAFSAAEDRPGGAPVAIVSYRFWQRRFGGTPDAIGRQVVFEGKPYTVTGVAPRGLWLDGAQADILTPLGQDTSPSMQNREAHSLRVWARLRRGATLAEARAELAVMARGLSRQYPKSNQGRSFIAEPLRPDVGDVKPALWLLLGAVSLVLCIACANLASILLARAVSRERELAMRMALGAGRGRLARQCLTESAVLGLAGGALGVLLAAAGTHPFVAAWPGDLPRAEAIQLDWRVLLFALGVSFCCGILFGLAPALRVPSHDLEQTLRAGGRTVAGGTRRLHGAMVVCEISLAVVLLISAGMLGRTLLDLSKLDPGVNVHHVLTARVALSARALESPDRTRAAWRDLLGRMRQVPGVDAIAMVDTVPMRDGNNQIGYWLTSAEPPPGEQHLALASAVSPEYFQVTGLPLRKGRLFTEQDRMGSEPVVVIDEAMAGEAFGKGEPLGKRVSIGLGTDPLRVIGVVGHVRYWGPAGDDDPAHVRSQLYYPFAQVPDLFVRRWSELMSIAVRTNVDPLSVTPALRHVLRGDANDQVLYEVRTLEQIARGALARHRFLTLLFGSFAGLALLLACIGTYGVLAYLTSRRVAEIGVRMALGATASQVIRLVLRQSLTMIFTGACLGSAAALAAGRLLERLVEGMRPAEPLTFALMVMVLTGAALAASYLPARRASRIHPTAALREE